LFFNVGRSSALDIWSLAVNVALMYTGGLLFPLFARADGKLEGGENVLKRQVMLLGMPEVLLVDAGVKGEKWRSCLASAGTKPASRDFIYFAKRDLNAFPMPDGTWGFVHGLLEWSPSTRPSAETVLRHSFLEDFFYF
jgi:serine/threonine protein kinase